MENVLICLTLLLLLVISGVISRLITSIPAPFVQIFVGALTSLFFTPLQVDFNPEVFMLLFIPPLLFSDSWHFPKREFLSNTRPIIMLSIGLVFFTVGGLGYLVHWFLPMIPLAACFALAAALSPTDAVALKSLTAKIGMPERMRHILQGEALLNDASGLVSFKFALAALISGFFSIEDAGISLLVVSAGGIIVGVCLTYAFITILGQLSLRGDDETTIENLVLILLPYATYLTAEHFGFSGILAAVTAGFSMDKAGFLDKTMVTMRIEGRFIWGMLEITLNGIIFILLGLYLPNTFSLMADIGFEPSACLTIVGIITTTLIGLRFLWIFCTLPFEALIARHKGKKWHIPNFKLVTAISFGGIRGAIALAAILSFPASMDDGAPFPYRDLLIIIVVGVVLCSLLLSTLVLPLILPKLKNLIAQSPAEEENFARIAASQAGIRAIEQKMEKLIGAMEEEEDAAMCRQVGSSLMASLNLFIAAAIGEEIEKTNSLRALTFEESLRLAALEGARQELKMLKKTGKINNTTLITIMHRLDLRQISLIDERTPSFHSHSRKK